MVKKNKFVKFDETDIEDDKDLYKTEHFTIPQIQRKSKNVRTEKEKTFEPSEFVSPIRGRNVKDVKDSEFINGFGNVGERYKNMKAAGEDTAKDVSDFEDVTFKNAKQNAISRQNKLKTSNDDLYADVTFTKRDQVKPTKQVFKHDSNIEQTPMYEEEFTVSKKVGKINTEIEIMEDSLKDKSKGVSNIHKKYNNTVNDDTMVFNTEYMMNQLNSNRNRKKFLDEQEEEIFIDELEEEYEVDNTFDSKELIRDEDNEEFNDFFGSGLKIETREADSKIIGKQFDFRKNKSKKVIQGNTSNNVIEEETMFRPQQNTEVSANNVAHINNMTQANNVSHTNSMTQANNLTRKNDMTQTNDMIRKNDTVQGNSVTHEEYTYKARMPFSGGYELPPVSLLKKSNIDLECIPEWVEEQSQMLDETFTQFGIDAKVERFRKGPTVTRYEVKLAAGINVKKIMGIKDNIKMNMAAKDIRIEAPIPGKPNVGIEVPNIVSDLVAFGNIADTPEFRETSPLSIGLGLSIDGTNIYTDIAKMPHGLIAGATGSGKSVCINTLLVSLLMKNSPEELRLMLIDPKVVELIAYNDLPHLITPVINDPKVAAGGLTWAVDEMERRYKLFAQNRVRDIAGYNRKNEDSKMAYIVIVIDELADLMMVASNEVEDSIQRLTQKSRACGIHLIVATQRPTTDVVKGTIKSNIPSRIAFRVASFTDSVTILDSQGAESLLGMGDMLVSDGGVEKVRVQGAYISDSEIDAVTDFIRSQREPSYVFEHEQLLKTQTSDGFSQIDELVQEVAYYVVENKTASINKIQKEFSIGFNRAQKIVDSLEMLNIVSENVGTKPREVLVDMTELKLIMEDL